MIGIYSFEGKSDSIIRDEPRVNKRCFDGFMSEGSYNFGRVRHVTDGITDYIVKYMSKSVIKCNATMPVHSHGKVYFSKQILKCVMPDFYTLFTDDHTHGMGDDVMIMNNEDPMIDVFPREQILFGMDSMVAFYCNKFDVSNLNCGDKYAINMMWTLIYLMKPIDYDLTDRAGIEIKYEEVTNGGYDSDEVDFEYICANLKDTKFKIHSKWSDAVNRLIDEVYCAIINHKNMSQWSLYTIDTLITNHKINALYSACDNLNVLIRTNRLTNIDQFIIVHNDDDVLTRSNIRIVNWLLIYMSDYFEFEYIYINFYFELLLLDPIYFLNLIE